MLWEPKFFGVKPHMVLKGGQLAYAQVGDANASIPTPQPYLPRPVWGFTGRAPGRTRSTSWLRRPALDGRHREDRSLKPLRGDHNTRDVTKADMIHNDALPKIEVDPDTFDVTIGGATTSDVRTELDGHRSTPTSPNFPWHSGTSSSDPHGRVVARPPRSRPPPPERQPPPMSRAALLLLADGRFPAGGHAHSGGVEAAVAAGRVHDTASLEAFCRGRLHTAGLTRPGSPPRPPPDRRPALDDAADARTPVTGTARRRPPARPADDAGGPRHLALADSTSWPGPPQGAHQPVVLGVTARAARLPRSTPPRPPPTRASAARPPQRCGC